MMTIKTKPSNRLSFFHRNQAFTLIEILVTLIIVAVLSMMAIVNLSRSTTKAEESKACHDLRSMKTAVELYNENNSTKYPPASPTTLIGTINTELGLSITPSGGTTYSCVTGTTNPCSATLKDGTTILTTQSTVCLST